MLELRNVTAGYDGHLILRNVSLTVPDDAVVALIGPNGAGKTTLLRVASGLLAPTSGSVLVDGVDLSGSGAHVLARAGVGHVPEGRGVFATLSVHDNLLLQADRGSTSQFINTVVQAFPRLGERMNQRAGTMSGGEQQMLAMAGAYSGASSTMLLDEVSMGLAPRIVDDIYENLQHLVTLGASFLIVEQYIQRVLDIADYVYLLEKGQIAFAGEPGELDDERVLAAYLGSEHG